MKTGNLPDPRNSQSDRKLKILSHLLSISEKLAMCQTSEMSSYFLTVDSLSYDIGNFDGKK